MRIPLAVKVLLAFMAVIAAGTLPIRLGVGTRMRDMAAQGHAVEMERRAVLLAERLATVSTAELPSATGQVAALYTERVTLVAVDGKVLFDSRGLRDLDNHLTRPEVRDALTLGLGSSERTSGTDGMRYLYAAAPVPGPQGARAVVRIAGPTAVADALADTASTLVDRATAVSVSAALLLSLLAVYALVRPLRRMRDGATRLAQGELTLTLDVATRDELEELARALEGVGAQLRARLAAAGSGDALVGQMVHAMVQGVVLLGPDGRVQHINGVARAKLGLRGPRESERLTALLEAPVVRSAIDESVKDPLGIDIRVPHPVTREPIDGVVVALRRPLGQPSHALVLDVAHGDAATLLDIPDLADVKAVPFRELMDRAMNRVREDLEDSESGFTAPDEWPGSNVVDAGGRVENAVTDTLRAAARAAGNQAHTPLTAHVQEHAVCLRLAVVIPDELIAQLQPRLSPLGGRVQCLGGRVELWLPLA